jgi:outer membrane usher protein
MAVPSGAPQARRCFRAAVFLCQSGTSRADDYFDPAALEFANPQQKMADLHYFAKSGGQQPGTYPVSIWVNNQQVAEGQWYSSTIAGYCSRR